MNAGRCMVPGSGPDCGQCAIKRRLTRAAAVRAVGILQQDDWIDSRPGVGRFVRSRHSMVARQAPGRAVELLGGDEAAGVKVFKVGPVLAPTRAATALNLPVGTPVIAR